MAGLYRPENELLIGTKQEAVENTDYTIMSDIYTSRGARGRWAEAFDGSTNGFYADYDLKIFLRKPTNIYGISTYNLGNSILNIYDENRNNVNSLYKTNYIDCNFKWTLMFKNVQPGIYHFNADTTNYHSLLSEIFLEINYIYLIRKNNKYYNIDNENYDIVEKEYSNLTQNSDILDLFKNKSFALDSLFQEVTINDETFKPIDKFDKFRLCRI